VDPGKTHSGLQGSIRDEEGGGRGRRAPPPAYWPTWSPEVSWCRWAPMPGCQGWQATRRGNGLAFGAAGRAHAPPLMGGDGRPSGFRTSLTPCRDATDSGWNQRPGRCRRNHWESLTENCRDGSPLAHSAGQRHGDRAPSKSSIAPWHTGLTDTACHRGRQPASQLARGALSARCHGAIRPCPRSCEHRREPGVRCGTGPAPSRRTGMSQPPKVESPGIRHESRGRRGLEEPKLSGPARDSLRR
jgi:hypothetical protein